MFYCFSYRVFGTLWDEMLQNETEIVGDITFLLIVHLKLKSSHLYNNNNIEVFCFPFHPIKENRAHNIN